MKKLLILSSLIMAISQNTYANDVYDNEIKDLVLINQIQNQASNDIIIEERVSEVKYQLKEINDGTGFALYSPDGKYLIISNTDYIRDITYIYKTSTWENISTLTNTSGKISCINTNQKGLIILIGDTLVYETEYFSEPHRFIYSGETMDNEFFISDNIASESAIDLSSVLIKSGNNLFNYHNLDKPDLIYSDVIYKKIN